MGEWDEEFTVCEDYDLWLKVTSKYSVGFVEDPIIIKNGGHQDQLSRKYFAMDYWRVKSMDRILKTANLTDDVIIQLREWMTNHILTFDSLYVPFIRIDKYIEESKQKN